MKRKDGGDEVSVKVQAGVIGPGTLQPGMSSTGWDQAWDGKGHEKPASGNTRN